MEPDLASRSLPAMKGPENLWVRANHESGHGFGTIKCHTDHRYRDNLEWIDLSGNAYTSNPVCVAYNVEATGSIAIDKLVWDGESWVQPSAVDFASDSDFSFDITESEHTGVAPGTYDVDAGTYTVSENDPGTGWTLFHLGVCEDPGDPWQPQVAQTVAPEVTVGPGEEVQLCAYNYPTTSLTVTKDNSTSEGPFTFEVYRDGDLYDTVTGTDGDVFDEAVPFGEYTVVELLDGAAVPGQDQCPDPNPDGEGIYTANTGPATLAEPGASGTITVSNNDCGVVAGSGSLVIEKYSDFDGDAAVNGDDAPIEGWTFTIEGPEAGLRWHR
ncbi:MAG: hypothetical protein U5Q44_03010 [Dehalococcoidia bacterium]|nr:hypothetical protein [Dehalococcoidia bacterium]